MKIVLRLEELGMFLASIGVLYFFGVSSWWYLLLLLGPDISMIAYMGGKKAGAIMYNTFHHKGIAVLFIITGFYFENETVLFTGIVLFGHSSMDRFLGYGLKYFEGFKYTHLGQIGNRKL